MVLLRFWLGMYREEIRQKIITIILEGQTKPSKIKSVMKWWSKCISMIIAKTASRNVATIGKIKLCPRNQGLGT